MTPLRPAEHVAQSYIGSELVLLDLQNGQYFGLNSVGTEVWKGLETSKSIDEIIRTICNTHQAARDVVTRDVEALLLTLQEANLLQDARLNNDISC